MLTGNTKVKLSQIIDLLNWRKLDKKCTQDAENLPPRKWSDGKMHEKVAGEWREVQKSGTKAEQKENAKSEKISVKFDPIDEKRGNFEVKGHPSIDHFWLNYFSGKFQLKTVYKDETVGPAKYFKTKEEAVQKINSIVGINEPQPKKKTSETASKPAQKKGLKADTKIKVKTSKTTEAKKDNLSTKEKPMSSWEKEEQIVKQRESEKPTMIDGYESWKGVINIDKKLRKKWEQLYSKLTDDEVEAIDTWAEPMGGDPYMDIQAYTRDPNGYRGFEDGDKKTRNFLAKATVEKTVKNLDRAFKKAPAIGTNLIVFCGQGNHSMFYNSLGIKETNKDRLANEIKKHIGEKITDNSYLATSVNEKGAESWHGHPIEIRIKVPKDKKGIYLNASNIDNYKYTEDDAENELLLNRGSKYKIEKVSTGRNRAGKKGVLVELELIDDGVKR